MQIIDLNKEQVEDIEERLDTFGYQGKEFYLALDYEQVGFYQNEQDNYEEFFFLKRI